MAKSIIELNESDISKILSEKFNTDINNIQLKGCTETRGYGMNEYEVSVVKATITKEDFKYD